VSDPSYSGANLATTDFLRAPENIAVLLNANAKQVNLRLHTALSSLVPAANLFLSRDAAEADEIADTVVSRGYETVFTGGGDGTFVSWVNHLLDRAERRRAAVPKFGVLALGTGNAVAEMVGAGRPVEDLRRYLRGEVPPARRIDLVTCNGRRTPFAGAGIDAAVLEDYNWVRRSLGGRAAAGIKGYGLAIALRSAPRQAFGRPVYTEVVNTGRRAWRLDAAGERAGRPVEAGELLYAGSCMLVAASTVPYYGFGMRAFPFAGRRPGVLQLRIATRIPLASLFFRVPQIFSGEFSHPGLLDFEAEGVSVSFDREVPFQVGGDSGGRRREMSLGIAPRGVELLDYAARARRLAA